MTNVYSRHMTGRINETETWSLIHIGCYTMVRIEPEVTRVSAGGWNGVGSVRYERVGYLFGGYSLVLNQMGLTKRIKV